jgi:hypothetical protein
MAMPPRNRYAPLVEVMELGLEPRGGSQRAVSQLCTIRMDVPWNVSMEKMTHVYGMRKASTPNNVGFPGEGQL